MAAKATTNQAASASASSEASVDPIRLSLSSVVLQTAGSRSPIYPETTSELQLDSGDIIGIQFKVLDAATDLPFAARHVALAIENKASKASASFLFTQGEKGLYTLELNLGAESTLERLSSPSGDHQLTLIITDPRSRSPLVYTLGTADIDTTAADELLMKPNEAGDTFRALPEILHRNRIDDRVAPRSASSLFTALWSALGANISNLTASTSIAVYGFTYTGSLAALLGLLVVYWKQLTLFDLIAYGSVLSLIAALLGRQTLVARFNLRKKLGIAI
eukprot:jgi/Hompol1/2416/HPOL_001807-RA